MSETTNDIEAILETITPAERTADICLRGDLSARLEDLEVELAEAIQYDLGHNVTPPTASAVVERIAEVQEQMRAAVRTFRLVSIGATAWRQVVAEHPPPPDDVVGMRWDPETFAPAALAECCIDPVMSEEQAARLRTKLSDAQWEKLCAAMYAANMGDDLPKFASATDALRTSAPSLTTAPPEESLTASS